MSKYKDVWIHPDHLKSKKGQRWPQSVETGPVEGYIHFQKVVDTQSEKVEAGPSDTERLDWMIENFAIPLNYGTYWRISYNDGCQVDRRKFDSSREAIDAAMKEDNAK